LTVVPNGVDTAYFHSTETERNSETLIFTGTAGYKPNDDAVQWLVEGILPGILKVRPGVRLILAGMNAGSRWGQYRKEGHIEVHCSVPDMRPLLGCAAVSVVPLRSGSGTRLKILEALSSGCAVVSTSIGAEGLDVISGRDLLIADSEAEFVSDVCQLLQDETLRKMLCQHGRWRVEHSYDWQTLERRAIDILAKAFC
jgi:glycosyltransferase involved in cell wall biosynthesis